MHISQKQMCWATQVLPTLVTNLQTASLMKLMYIVYLIPKHRLLEGKFTIFIRVTLCIAENLNF